MDLFAVPSFNTTAFAGFLSTLASSEIPPPRLKGLARSQIEQLRGREPDAWRSLFLETMPAIYQYVRTRIGNADDSEDVTSEVFEQAWRAADSLEERGVPPRAWLFGIARNVVGNHRRRWMRRPPEITLEVYDGPAPDVPLSPEQLDLAHAIARLSRDHAEVISLRFIHGLSLAEVAAALDTTIDAVKGRQARALAVLREDLERPA